MKAIRTATIRESASTQPITLELRHDRDAYRWYERGTGADTEVSGPTIDTAIQAAHNAWMDWSIRFAVQA